MVDDQSDDDGTAVRLSKTLSKLSTQYGVWNNDLAWTIDEGLLRHWEIDPTAPLEAIRTDVIGKLKGYIRDLQPTTRSTKEAFCHSVGVSFNVEEYPDLRERDRDYRWNWVARLEGDLYVSRRSSQRYLKSAIKQIVKRILREGYKAIHDNATSESPQPVKAGAVVLPPADREVTRETHLSPLVVEYLRPRRISTWQIVLLLVAIGATTGGLVLPQLYQPSLIWHGTLTKLSEFVVSNYRPISAVLGAISMPLLWLIATRIRHRLVSRPQKAALVLCVALVLVLPVSLFFNMATAHDNELSEDAALRAQLPDWYSVPTEEFDRINSPVDPGAACNETSVSLTRIDTEDVITQTMLTTHLDAEKCVEQNGTLTLAAGEVAPGRPLVKDINVYGRLHVDGKGDFYAETLVRPSSKPDSDCGLSAATDLSDDTPDTFRNFILQGSPTEAGAIYQPVVESYDVSGQTAKVLMYGTAIPRQPGRPGLDNEPRKGWVKLGLLREGNYYKFFVNDHMVLGSQWKPRDTPTQPQLLASATELSSSINASSCEFDYFKVWYEKRS